MKRGIESRRLVGACFVVVFLLWGCRGTNAPDGAASASGPLTSDLRDPTPLTAEERSELDSRVRELDLLLADESSASSRVRASIAAEQVEMARLRGRTDLPVEDIALRMATARAAFLGRERTRADFAVADVSARAASGYYAETARDAERAAAHAAAREERLVERSDEEPRVYAPVSERAERIVADGTAEAEALMPPRRASRGGVR